MNKNKEIGCNCEQRGKIVENKQKARRIVGEAVIIAGAGGGKREGFQVRAVRLIIAGCFLRNVGSKGVSG